MKKTLLTVLALVPLLAFAQAPNDECATATALTVSPNTTCATPFTTTSNGATAGTATPLCEFNATSPDVWYSFTATTTKAFVSIENAVNDLNYPAYDVYEGSCSATPMLCTGTSGNLLSSLTVGQTYYLRVYNLYYPTVTNVAYTICISTPATPITVSETLYTPQELVTTVLANGSPATIANVVTSSAIDFTTYNSLGYFNKAESTFGLTSGIILSTGTISLAPGPNTTSQAAGAPINVWTGDADLQAVVPLEGGGPTASYQNATSIAFDFVAPSDYLSLNYIFASEEYGIFQCNYSDAFAIILTDITAATPPQNIAVIPGTTIPVSVTTVHNNAYNPQCPSQNANYFGAYYVDNGAELTAPVNFNGITVPLSAEAALVAGNTYHIKFVIADRIDQVYDSALFIEGNIFDVPVAPIVPDAPTGETTQTFIEGETIDDLEVEGENIQWYATETGGTPLDKTATLNSLTLLVDGATYYASQTIDGVESTQRLGITVTKILSTNSNTIAGLSYYPNPVKSQFTITHKAAINTVTVYNTLGQQVLAKTVNNSEATVDFSALNNGIYFVKVQAGSSQQTIKVVKE